jgi:hypothetical protein
MKDLVRLLVSFRSHFFLALLGPQGGETQYNDLQSLLVCLRSDFGLIGGEMLGLATDNLANGAEVNGQNGQKLPKNLTLVSRVMLLFQVEKDLSSKYSIKAITDLAWKKSPFRWTLWSDFYFGSSKSSPYRTRASTGCLGDILPNSNSGSGRDLQS